VLDLKQIRENPETISDRLRKRGEYDIAPILELDRELRQLQTQRSQLQARSNEIGKQIGQKMRGGGNADDPELAELKAEGNETKRRLGELEPRERELKTQIEQQLLRLPNLPSETTPVGEDETDNVEVRRWGDAYLPQKPSIPHWELGEKLGILDIERAVKVSRSRFVALVGAGAALERALISFMLDRQIQAGYLEVMPPILINSDSMVGTSQLPKFGDESFHIERDDLWMAPTAEVPVTNLYRDEILNADELPIYHCSYTPCFRREAGSYGQDTRGLIRVHQFNKVELVKIVSPDNSAVEHESLVQDAEAILQELQLPYRVMELCTGDLGFGAAKCYDLEVWMPSSEQYREISSCSNFGDFQARRANIRMKEPGKKGTRFAHTLNGSGLAIGRTMAAILENYQQEDGNVRIPNALQPYLHREFLL
jgi:seryl-tRNA synthetase